MDIKDIAFILNSTVVNCVRVADNAPESFYNELLAAETADYYVIVTETTGPAYVCGKWDGTYFYPELDEEWLEVNKMFYNPELSYIMPLEPCPKPGEMYWDMEEEAWIDIAE